MTRTYSTCRSEHPRRRPAASHRDRAHRADRRVPVVARPVHRQHRLPEHLGELPRREPQLAVVGAQRLHDRLRRGPGPGRPLGGPRRAQARLPLGLAVFTPRRRLCAVAPSLGFLVGARVLQATGGALMLPTSLGLLLPAFGPARKGAAIGLWSAVGGAAAALRPADRRPARPGQLALGLPGEPALQPARARLRGARCCARCGTRRPTRRTCVGAALLSVSVAALVAAIVEGTDWGWTSPRILGAFALAGRLGRLARGALVAPPPPDPRAGGDPAPRRARWPTSARSPSSAASVPSSSAGCCS